MMLIHHKPADLTRADTRARITVLLGDLHTCKLYKVDMKRGRSCARGAAEWSL